MVRITLEDGSVREFSRGTTAREVAASISKQLENQTLAVTFNDKPVPYDYPLTQNGSIVFFTWDQAEGKKAFWRSSAHIMAAAVEYFFPRVKLVIGLPIDQGFYYDMDLGGQELSAAMLENIETKFLQIARQNLPFHCRNVSKNYALDFYRNNEYKQEILQDFKDGDVTFCVQGDFEDLCRGPHLPHTGYVKAFKITNIAGAYWRGDENNPMLTRMYGISFPTQALMAEYQKRMEQAQKRDHRKLGKQLELFTFSEKVGMGLPLWLPNGAILHDRLKQFLYAAQLQTGYQPVVTPHIAHKDLYVQSGHYDKYGKDSFQPIHSPREGESFFLKPMNCPHHCELYKAKTYSYRDLPVRLAEFGTVYRYEQHGELHGLTRVRSFTQDDAHLFCREDQLTDEFKAVIDLVLFVFEAVGFSKYDVQISLRDPQNPAKYIGSEDHWHAAEQSIMQAVQEKQIPATVEYGEAAFYGPKLDFMVQDAIGRKWQLGTIQVDYNLPERFDLSYVDANNQKQRPVMIHRAPFGSIERFIAVLLEHTEGKFPTWLAPIQAVVLPIAEPFFAYAEQVVQQFCSAGIRIQADLRSERINKKIREAESKKIPFMLVVGQQEADTQSVSLRAHTQGAQGMQPTADVLSMLVQACSAPQFLHQ